jgi:O-antigen/teichoic acid export membrane protein
MKKNSFMNGAFIATIAIVISKIIGVLYVIPFYPLLGEKGGALYGYAYTIYGLFLNLSTAGIPFAISKLTSEYNALEMHYTKERAYKISKYLICGLGLVSFFALFLFSKDLAYVFIGDIKGGNSIDDVSFVIKVVSTALLIVPILSVLRGYLQGQKYITPSSISQVLEQLVRVAFLLIGSFLSLKVFHLSLTTTVGVAVFAATFGALIAYFYMFDKTRKNREKLNRDAKETR